MNRSVRTKITALGLCVTLMFTALTGCGNKDAITILYWINGFTT